MRVSRVQWFMNNRPIIGVLGPLVILLMTGIFCSYKQLQNGKDYDLADVLYFRATEGTLSAPSSPRHKRWIVVTSIQAPTSQMQKLASLPGWKMVVVGDLKSPGNWSLPGVKYLSVREQESFGYSVLQYIPYSSYSRKIVGYLYAIQHGAKEIYDTDDDNAPDADLAGFDDPAVLVVNTSASTYNPCPHFGQSSVWPRGYPLDMVGVTAPHTYNICAGRPSVLVQQALVNGDPDVDAIFRLTRKFVSKDLDIKFDSAAPPVVLPSGTFTPYNAQNTVFEYEALWSLVLPRTVTFRITDIWRSYWTQALMWLTGGRLAYYPPRTTQRRNPHSYIRDAREETDMYVQTPDLMKFLSGWHCLHDNLPKCAMQLTVDMVKGGFWGEGEIPLYHAWIQDLFSIGYRFPVLQTYACSVRKTVACYPNEQPTSVN